MFGTEHICAVTLVVFDFFFLPNYYFNITLEINDSMLEPVVNIKTNIDVH